MSLDWQDFQGVNAGTCSSCTSVPARSAVGGRVHARVLRAWTPPADRRRLPRRVRACPPRWRRSRAVSSRAPSSAPSTSSQAIRRYGHLAAADRSARAAGRSAIRRSSPRRTASPRPTCARCRPRSSRARSPTAPPRCADVVERLRAIYCSTTGYDFAHIFVPEERHWLRDAVETGRFRAPADPIDPMALLDRLTDVEAFERFLHRTFPGKTRFSIEGLDMLVPILDEVIAEAAEAGMRQAFIGMAHRGRLNVMAHVLGKPYEQILAEFKDPVRNALCRRRRAVERRREVPPRRVARGQRRRGASTWSSRCRRTRAISRRSIRCSKAWRARPAPTASQPGAPVFNPDAVLPILIHGDAAFPGQGVVAETLNLHRLDGLHDRRHDSHHREQPDRVHDRPGRFVQHALRERPGARVQDSDHPRQRRRSGSVRRRGAAGVRLPRRSSGATS